MVEREVVLQTIRRMYEAGIDDATIRATLEDIGLSDEEMAEFMSSARGEAEAAASAEEEKNAELREQIAARTAERVREHLEAERAEREMRETGSKLESAESAERLGELHRSVEALHERVASVQPIPSDVAGKVNILSERLAALEKDMQDVKAGTNALQSLLKKVLSTDREILADLSKKK